MARKSPKKKKAASAARRKSKRAFGILASRRANILNNLSKRRKPKRKKSASITFVTSFVRPKARKAKVQKKKAKAAKKSPVLSRPKKKSSVKAAPAAPETQGQLVYPMGSKSLDDLLGGGIRDGTSVLILGNPHCGKKPLLMNFMKQNCCRQKTQFVLVLTDIGVNNWISMAKQNNWSCEKDNCGTMFVDCYSQQFNVCASAPKVKCLDVPFSLSSVSISVADFIEQCQNEKKRPFIVLHSVSTLFEMFGEEETYRFLQFFIGKLKLSKTPVVLSMQLGIHGKRAETSISSLVDCVITMNNNKISASGYLSIRDGKEHPYSFKKNKLQIEFQE